MSPEFCLVVERLAYPSSSGRFYVISEVQEVVLTGTRSDISRWLRTRIMEHLEQAHTGVKPSVLRRGAQRIGNFILGNWLTCWDPVHLGGMRTTMAIEAVIRESLGPLVDLACEQLFHGHVLPVQRVLVLIDEARSAALGKCVCRASGVTRDLVAEEDSARDLAAVPGRIRDREKQNRVYLVAPTAVVAEHLEAVLQAYDRIRMDQRTEERTAPRLVHILEQVKESRTLPPEERLGLLWRETYPYWEVLLRHEGFTRKWADNMAQHDKSLPVHRELLKALVLAHYHVRGAVFTGMEVVDEAYAICTCPGPENDRGCSLVNWYYFSRLDHALYPNTDDFFGQARDEQGNPLPCQRFSARMSRPCLGCGCEHEPGKKTVGPKIHPGSSR